MLVISLSQVIFIISIALLAIGTLFMIPLPKGWKQELILFVERSKVVKKLVKYLNILIVIVTLHWIYSINAAHQFEDMHQLEKENSYHQVSQRDLHILENKFRAEGDIYLNGTLLIAAIFVNRLLALLQQYYEIKDAAEKELKVDLSKSLDKIQNTAESKKNN